MTPALLRSARPAVRARREVGTTCPAGAAGAPGLARVKGDRRSSRRDRGAERSEHHRPLRRANDGASWGAGSRDQRLGAGRPPPPPFKVLGGKKNAPALWSARV